MAYLKLVADVKERNHLVITEFSNVHNHETAPELFKHYPQARRLDSELRQKVEQLLSFEVKASVLVQIVQIFTGKSVTNKDLHNIRTRMRKMQQKEGVVESADADSAKPPRRKRVDRVELESRRAATQKLKLSYSVGSTDQCMTEVRQLCTHYAAELIQAQINATRKLSGVTVVPTGLVTGTPKEEFQVTSDTCSCPFQRKQLLPCRHVFYMRSHLHLPPFSPHLVDARWLLANQTQPPHASAPATQRDETVTLANKLEQYNVALGVCKVMCDHVAEVNEVEFKVKCALLEKLTRLWKMNRSVELVAADAEEEWRSDETEEDHEAEEEGYTDVTQYLEATASDDEMAGGGSDETCGNTETERTMQTSVDEPTPRQETRQSPVKKVTIGCYKRAGIHSDYRPKMNRVDKKCVNRTVAVENFITDASQEMKPSCVAAASEGTKRARFYNPSLMPNWLFQSTLYYLDNDMDVGNCFIGSYFNNRIKLFKGDFELLRSTEPIQANLFDAYASTLIPDLTSNALSYVSMSLSNRIFHDGLYDSVDALSLKLNRQHTLLVPFANDGDDSYGVLLVHVAEKSIFYYNSSREEEQSPSNAIQKLIVFLYKGEVYNSNRGWRLDYLKAPRHTEDQRANSGIYALNVIRRLAKNDGFGLDLCPREFRLHVQVELLERSESVINYCLYCGSDVSLVSASVSVECKDCGRKMCSYHLGLEAVTSEVPSVTCVPCENQKKKEGGALKVPSQSTLNPVIKIEYSH